eukprot:scaffold3085_cov91-Skeletonema_dohrnii-CCMP3373.AAC.1
MEALSWLYEDDPSVEDAKAFIENHPDALTVPLHKAMEYSASDEVILLLLEACPQAAKELSDGFNALHHAIRMCSEKVIKALINAHPGAASARNLIQEVYHCMML